MRGTWGAPHCAAGNAQQNCLCSPSPPGLMGNVHPACVPSSGAHAPRWGIFLQHLSLLTVAAGKCYRSSWPASSRYALAACCLAAVPRTGCVFCTGEPWAPVLLPEASALLPKTQASSPWLPETFNEEMMTLWLKPRFWILLNFLLLSLSPPSAGWWSTPWISKTLTYLQSVLSASWDPWKLSTVCLVSHASLSHLLSLGCGEYVISKDVCGGVFQAAFRCKLSGGFCMVCAGFSPSWGQEVSLDGQENYSLPAYLPWSSFMQGHADGSGAEAEQCAVKERFFSRSYWRTSKVW